MQNRRTWLAVVGAGLMVWPVILAGCNGDNDSGGPIFGATPTPTNPGPTATPGGSATATPRPTTGACTTGTGNATFSSVLAPILSTPIRNGCANGAIVSVGGRTGSVTVAFADTQSGKARALTFTVSDFIGGVTAGKSFTIGGTNVATYSESTVGGGAITQWMGTGGTFRINTLQGNNATVTLTNVRFGPGRSVGGIIAGTGTFTVNGSATVTLTPR